MKRAFAWTVLIVWALASTAHGQDGEPEFPAPPADEFTERTDDISPPLSQDVEPTQGDDATPPQVDDVTPSPSNDIPPAEIEPPTQSYDETPAPEQPTEDPYKESGDFGKSDYDVAPNPDAFGSDAPIFHVGPTVQLGFPHPINYGIEALAFNYLSFGISTGSFELEIDPAKVKIENTQVHFRGHPFGDSFFIGFAYGKQKLTGTAEDDIELASGGFATTVPAVIDIEIDSNYFTPHLGWFAHYHTGLVLGFELGAQIPVDPKAKVDLDTSGLNAIQTAAIRASADYRDLKKKAEDAAKLLGEKTVPFVTLFRIGYLF